LHATSPAIAPVTGIRNPFEKRRLEAGTFSRTARHCFPGSFRYFYVAGIREASEPTSAGETPHMDETMK